MLILRPLRAKRTFFSFSFSFALLLLTAPLALFRCTCDDRPSGERSELKSDKDSLLYSASEGQEETKEVVISCAAGSAEVQKITISEGAQFFKIVAGLPTLPLLMNQGDKFTLKVSYTSVGGVTASGKLRIESDAQIPSDGYLDVKLLSVINQQRLVVDPNPVDFGQMDLGAKKTIDVKVSNLGTALVKITSIKWDPASSPAFTFPDGRPEGPKELKPQESFTFKVDFSPTTRNPDQGAMAFLCEGGCSPGDPDPSKRGNTYLVRFQGGLAAPSIVIDPQQIDFGFVASGTTESRTLKISNAGTAKLSISKLSLKAGSSGSFIVPTITGVDIEPGQTRPVVVQYRPGVAPKDEGVVEIASNDPAKPLVDVPLFGKLSAPKIDVTPRKLNFGKVAATKTLGVTIANSGDRDLDLRSIALGQGTSQSYSLRGLPTTPAVLKPQSYVAIQVVFQPQAAGKMTGTLEIVSSDPLEPKVVVTIEGEGTSIRECDLLPAPNPVNYGLSIIGKTKIIPIVWTNQGALDCKITTIETSMDRSGFPPYSGPEVFIIPAFPAQCPKGKCNPALVVPPGNNVVIEVGFSPASEKQTSPLGGSPTFNGTLSVSFDTSIPSPPYREADLIGLASRSCIEVVPDQLEVGKVTVGCSSRKEVITIYNTCAQAVTISKVDFSATTGANGFYIARLQQTPFTIPTGQSAEVQVAYRAAPPPSRQTSVLEISHSITQQSPLSIPLVAEGTLESEQTDTFKQNAKPEIDILFVIDDSGSMSEEQKSLGSNFSSFISFATSLGADFQIGVVTTDVDGQGNPFGGGTFKPGELRGSPKIMIPQTPNLSTVFLQNAQVGTNGSADEQGLEAARLALSPPLITTDLAQGGNKGFLRNSASLSVIIVSDEPDSSPQPVQYYVNFFKNLKGVRNPDLLRISAVVGYDASTKQNQCQGPGGSASGDARYPSVVSATNGVLASICAANWSQTLSQLGTVTFGYRRQFFLTRPADPATIQVKVNGQAVPSNNPPNGTPASGWQYIVADNSVEFLSPPPPNSTIDITYKAICY